MKQNLFQKTEEFSRDTSIFKQNLEELLNQIENNNKDLNCFLRTYLSLENLDQLFSAIVKTKKEKKLFGLTFAIKDNFFVKGQSLSLGLKPEIHASALEHANIVNHFISHGATLIGSTNLDECALGMTGENQYYGNVLNPTFKDKIIGGSSSGSVSAVAARLVDFAIGSDLAGSIRIPAGFTGSTAIRFSSQRYSKNGSFLLDTELDSVGLVSSSIANLAFLDSLIDTNPLTKKSAQFFIPKKAIEDKLCGTLQKSFFDFVSKINKTYQVDFIDDNLFEIANSNLKYLVIDAIRKDKRYLDIANKPDSLKALLLLAEDENIDSLIKLAKEEQVKVRNYLNSNILNLGFILTPTICLPPPSLKELHRNSSVIDESIYFLKLANFVDLPAITWPFRAVKDGDFPCSIQLMSANGDDANLLRWGSLIEQDIQN
jgi:amidase